MKIEDKIRDEKIQYDIIEKQEKYRHDQEVKFKNMKISQGKKY